MNNMPTPAIFTDPGYVKTGGNGNFVLSTSLVGYTSAMGGFSPMVKDGYGACYSIEAHRINFVVSAWRDSTVSSALAFRSAVHQSLRDVRDLLVASAGPEPVKLAKL
jgi:carnitine O-octanoyltransferase